MKRGTKGAWSAKYDWVEESVGANVSQYRRDRGLTQEQLAEQVGLEVKSLQRIEYGRSNSTARVLRALGDALGVSVNEFFLPNKVQPAKRGRPKKVS